MLCRTKRAGGGHRTRRCTPLFVAVRSTHSIEGTPSTAAVVDWNSNTVSWCRNIDLCGIWYIGLRTCCGNYCRRDEKSQDPPFLRGIFVHGNGTTHLDGTAVEVPVYRFTGFPFFPVCPVYRHFFFCHHFSPIYRQNAGKPGSLGIFRFLAQLGLLLSTLSHDMHADVNAGHSGALIGTSK